MSISASDNTERLETWKYLYQAQGDNGSGRELINMVAVISDAERNERQKLGLRENVDFPITRHIPWILETSPTSAFYREMPETMIVEPYDDCASPIQIGFHPDIAEHLLRGIRQSPSRVLDRIKSVVIHPSTDVGQLKTLSQFINPTTLTILEMSPYGKEICQLLESFGDTVIDLGLADRTAMFETPDFFGALPNLRRLRYSDVQPLHDRTINLILSHAKRFTHLSLHHPSYSSRALHSMMETLGSSISTPLEYLQISNIQTAHMDDINFAFIDLASGVYLNIFAEGNLKIQTDVKSGKRKHIGIIHNRSDDESNLVEDLTLGAGFETETQPDAQQILVGNTKHHVVQVHTMREFETSLAWQPQWFLQPGGNPLQGYYTPSSFLETVRHYDYRSNR